MNIEEHALIVVSCTSPEAISETNSERHTLTVEEEHDDANDSHNKPRLRRLLILQELQKRQSQSVKFLSPIKPLEGIDSYQSVHTKTLLSFLSDAWNDWLNLGEDGRDPDCSLHAEKSGVAPPLVPCNVPLPRESHQRSSKNVMGRIAYYCTDLCTPVVSRLLQELCWDAAVVETAVVQSLHSRASYALTTHPGHHAAKDSFGGYCYINHAAHAARLLQQRLDGSKVAVLDVDYHCGNGTASIFYEDPSVLVVSIHCDPDFEYPFHSGYADQTGAGEGIGTTMHIPLPPGTTWTSYRSALERSSEAITAYGAKALVVSLGLDTHDGDQVAVRRAGFHLSGKDYTQMGHLLKEKVPSSILTVFIQEGGYKMDVVAKAASDVVLGYCDT